MKTNKMLRIIALLAALVMTMAFAGAALADGEGDTPEVAVSSDTIDTSRTGSLTIYKYDLTAAQAASVTSYPKAGTGTADTATQTALADYALEGVEFTYVKVADIAQETVEGAADAGTKTTVKLTYTIPEALETALGMTDTNVNHKYSSDQLNTAIAAAATNPTIKNALETYAKNNGTAMDLTGEDGKTAKTGLDLGLYLVVETKVPENVNSTTNPFFVSLPMTDLTGDEWMYSVTVYPKNQTNVPTIDKLVKQSDDTTYEDVTTASIGDTLGYNIVSKLPTINSKSTYLTKYTFVDTILEGLSYKQDVDVVVAFYAAEDDAKQLTGTPVLTLTKDDDYTVTYGTDTMTITLTADGLAQVNPAMSDKFISVSYKATVDDDAVLGDSGNRNDVKLQYSRSNETEIGVIKDEARAYTYGIDMTKTFSETVADATPVTFTLEKITAGADGADAAETITAVKDGDTYVVSTAEGAVSEYHPTAAGKLQIEGLEAGTYRLTETKTVRGYELLKSPLTVVITASSVTITPSTASHQGGDDETTFSVTNPVAAAATVNGQDASMSSDGTSTNASVEFSVLNNKGHDLPQTGGWGTILFTMIGAAGLAAGTLLLRKKRK